ncbi:MAG: DnaJ-domain-containing protein 1 [Psychroserpens sp.]|jgi:DnaJ-domain-containing protein 1
MAGTKNTNHQTITMEESIISEEIKSHFLRLYQIALADEEFSPLEMRLLYKFANERNISKNQLDEILVAHSGQVTIPETLEKRIEYLYDFALMIWADRVVTDDEYSALKKYCRKFDFVEEKIIPLTDYLISSAKERKSKESILLELKTN